VEIPILWDFALLFALGAVFWGLLLAPFNSYSGDHVRSFIVGAVLVGACLVACHKSDWLFRLTARHHSVVWAVAVIMLTALWVDGGWRSSFYVASYCALAIAIVATDKRFTMSCAALLSGGYLCGLAINGYSLADLEALRDVDSVVANAGGYFVVAVFVGVPLDTARRTGHHPLRGPGFWADLTKSFIVNLGAGIVLLALAAVLSYRS
jgi:3-dehydroquinate dehydratase